MNASRFALVDLALGVVLLGLLPGSGVPTPVEHETAAIESLASPGAAAVSCQREAARLQGNARTEARASTRDETDETTGQLRQAELRLLRMLAAEDDQSDERAEPGQDTSEPSLLDELARLISWEKPADNRPDVATRGRRASASIPGSVPRVRH